MPKRQLFRKFPFGQRPSWRLWTSLRRHVPQASAGLPTSVQVSGTSIKNLILMACSNLDLGPFSISSKSDEQLRRTFLVHHGDRVFISFPHVPRRSNESLWQRGQHSQTAVLLLQSTIHCAKEVAPKAWIRFFGDSHFVASILSQVLSNVIAPIGNVAREGVD